MKELVLLFALFILKLKKPHMWYNTKVASPIGFEPMTARLEGVCSIQLS